MTYNFIKSTKLTCLSNIYKYFLERYVLSSLKIPKLQDADMDPHNWIKDSLKH